MPANRQTCNTNAIWPEITSVRQRAHALARKKTLELIQQGEQRHAITLLTGPVRPSHNYRGVASSPAAIPEFSEPDDDSTEV